MTRCSWNLFKKKKKTRILCKYSSEELRKMMIYSRSSDDLRPIWIMNSKKIPSRFQTHQNCRKLRVLFFSPHNAHNFMRILLREHGFFTPCSRVVDYYLSTVSSCCFFPPPLLYPQICPVTGEEKKKVSFRVRNGLEILDSQALLTYRHGP